MTLQQLKYVITVAETGTITEAANQIRESAFPKKGKAFWDMQDRYWNRRQFLKTNIKEMVVEKNSSVYQHSIILLR